MGDTLTKKNAEPGDISIHTLIKVILIPLALSNR